MDKVVDEKVQTYRGRDGQIREVVSRLVDMERPVGKAKVVIRDADTHKIVDQQENHNFVSRLWVHSSISWQRFAWSYRATLQSNTHPIYDWPSMAVTGRRPIHFPNYWLAAWNDATAEAPLTEHRAFMDKQGLVAIASRHPIGSPAGKRGSINVTDSFTDTIEEHLVYDWPITAGNGVMQSVGYLGVAQPSAGLNFAVPGLRPDLTDRKYYAYSSDLSTLMGLATSGLVYGQGGIDLSGNYVVFGRNTTSQLMTCMRILAADVETGFTLDEFGAGETQPTPNIPFSAISTSGMSTSGSPPNAGQRAIDFLGEYNSLYWVGFTSGTTGSYIASVNKTTGAFGTFVQTGTTSHGKAVGCVIGSEAFVANDLDTTMTVKRYDLTATPPTLTATISVDFPSEWGGGTIRSLVTNGTDLIAHTNSGGICQFNTSGTVLFIIGMPQNSLVTETASTPYAGTIVAPLMSYFEPFSVNRPASGTGGASATYSVGGPTHLLTQSGYPGFDSSTTDGVSLVWVNGKLCGQQKPYRLNSGNALLWSHAELGWNLATRVLLGAPMTKTSSNTMQITYITELPNIV